MQKTILIGTTNPLRTKLVEAALAPLPIKTLTPNDLNIDMHVQEDGRSTQENARKKAEAYFAVAQLPTLSIDGALHIVKLPANQQPGTYVKRIYASDQEATNEEIVQHYSATLDRVGGESLALWEGSVALVLSDDQLITHTFHFETLMTSQRKGEIPYGAPLDVLTIDVASGKYYSEMSWEERTAGVDVQEIMAFVLQNLGQV